MRKGRVSVLRFATLQAMFKRYRRPGDIVFAVVFLAFSAFLLSQLGRQVSWTGGNSLFARPVFWPAVSLISMTGFAALHLIGSLASPRIPGRWREVAFWLSGLEYAAWFMAYVWLVPLLGYLLATVLAALFLSLRAGYRSWRMLLAATLSAVFIVLIFKTFLQVRIPGGAIYDLLPSALRSFMLTYF